MRCGGPSATSLTTGGREPRPHQRPQAALQTAPREARDMRERRDVDRLNSHLVPPVSLGYPTHTAFLA